MATADTNQLERFATKAAEIFEKARVNLIYLLQIVTKKHNNLSNSLSLAEN